MLDRGATGKDCSPGPFGTLSVNDGPLAQRSCLAASGIDLCLRQGGTAPFADTLRRKDFDQVCSICYDLPDEGANLFGSPSRFIYRPQRSEYPWTRNCSACNGISKVPVAWRSDALHGREP